MMDYLFKFLVPALIAMVCGILTFLIGQSVGAAIVAGIYTGVATVGSYEWGLEEWTSDRLKYIIVELIGAIAGGAFGGIMFLAKG